MCCAEVVILSILGAGRPARSIPQLLRLHLPGVVIVCLVVRIGIPVCARDRPPATARIKRANMCAGEVLKRASRFPRGIRWSATVLHSGRNLSVIVPAFPAKGGPEASRRPRCHTRTESRSDARARRGVTAMAASEASPRSVRHASHQRGSDQHFPSAFDVDATSEQQP